MPTTVAGVLVLLIAVIPGALGSQVFDSLNGLNWREQDWKAAVRYVSFSAVGLAVYVLSASALHWPTAIHVLPSTYTAPDFGASKLPLLAYAFLGHLAAGGLVGFGAAYARRALALLTSSTPYPSSWDAFAREFTEGRWVVWTGPGPPDHGL